MDSELLELLLVMVLKKQTGVATRIADPGANQGF